MGKSSTPRSPVNPATAGAAAVPTATVASVGQPGRAEPGLWSFPEGFLVAGRPSGPHSAQCAFTGGAGLHQATWSVGPAGTGPVFGGPSPSTLNTAKPFVCGTSFGLLVLRGAARTSAVAPPSPGWRRPPLLQADSSAKSFQHHWRVSAPCITTSCSTALNQGGGNGLSTPSQSTGTPRLN